MGALLLLSVGSTLLMLWAVLAGWDDNQGDEDAKGKIVLPPWQTRAP